MTAADARSSPTRSRGPVTRLEPADVRDDRSRRLVDAERRIATVARVMDDLVTIPGLRRRVGLDALIGIIPGVGDLATAGVGAWIIAEARRFRLPGPVIGRMIVNLVIDLAIGAVPLLGDVFDVGFRSNARNLELFRRYAAEPGASGGSARSFLIGFGLVLLGIGWLAVSLVVRLLSIEIG